MFWFKTKEQKEEDLKRKEILAERQKLLSEEKNILIGYYYIIYNTEYQSGTDTVLTFSRHVGENTGEIKEEQLDKLEFRYNINEPKISYINKIEKEGFVCKSFIEKKTIEFLESKKD